MRLTKRQFLAAAGATTLLAGAGARSQEPWPSRPLVVVCPYDAGGITDAVSRLFARKLSEKLKQPAVVENRPGASGMVGTAHVARLPADGHTILFGSQSTMASNLSLFKTVSYDPLKDFIPLHGLTEQSPILLVQEGSPYRSLEDLLKFAKANPGKLNLGSPGTGTGTHLFGENFQDVVGVKFTNVPFRNTGQTTQALLAGTVDLIFDYPATAGAQIKAGKLRPLVYLGKERSAQVPSVPTISEAGFPAAVAVTWTGFFVRSGTPAAIVKRLEDALAASLQDADVSAAMETFGASAMKGMDSTQLRAFIAMEIPRWRDTIQRAGIKPE